MALATTQEAAHIRLRPTAITEDEDMMSLVAIEEEDDTHNGLTMIREVVEDLHSLP